MVHKKLKRFSCTLCSKSFGCRSNLSRHVALCHKGKPLSLQNSCKSQHQTFEGDSFFNTKEEFSTVENKDFNKDLDSKQSTKDTGNSLEGWQSELNKTKAELSGETGNNKEVTTDLDSVQLTEYTGNSQDNMVCEARQTESYSWYKPELELST